MGLSFTYPFLHFSLEPWLASFTHPFPHPSLDNSLWHNGLAVSFPTNIRNMPLISTYSAMTIQACRKYLRVETCADVVAIVPVVVVVVLFSPLVPVRDFCSWPGYSLVGSDDNIFAIADPFACQSSFVTTTQPTVSPLVLPDALPYTSPAHRPRQSSPAQWLSGIIIHQRDLPSSPSALRLYLPRYNLVS